MVQKVWGGRFREETDRVVERFNASIGFDRRLYAYDIKGSMAHCRMLAKQGVITEQEAREILTGLLEIRKTLDQDPGAFGQDYEDIHGLVETVLIDKIGEVGEKLHTARSRNDQVALDLRLYLRDVVDQTRNLIRALQRRILNLAEENEGVIMPGYTHLQRAQPVFLAHHLMAYFEMLGRDRERLLETRRRINVLPLGSAALAGSTFPLDRQMVAEELGFEAISENSMDGVSDRDFALEFLSNASILMMHLSRFSEDLVIWATQEFGFISLSDTLCTGSSIMPQKKNPDVPELIRGKTGRVYGSLFSLLTTMKGLPLTYNKDMQEDKEALFDAADTVRDCLEVTTRLLGGISFNKVKMREASEEGFLVATDLAEYLVRKGMAFRKAHQIVGQMVLFALDQGKTLKELSLSEMKRFAEPVDEDVYEWLDPESILRKKNTPGGPGLEMIKDRLKRAREELQG